MVEPVPERIALFTIESFVAAEAVARFVDRHHERISLIVTTDTVNGGVIVSIRRLYHIVQTSGFGFLPFLICNFYLYVLLVHVGKWFAAVTHRPRHLLPIRSLCRQHRISYLQTAAINSRDVRQALIRSSVDFIVVCYFDQILRTDIIETATRGVINLHTSLLPEYRGLFPEIHMLAANERRFGSTVHLIADASIDAGPILAKQETEIPQGGTVLDVSRILHLDGVEWLSHTVGEFDALHARATPQTGGSYFSFPSRAELRALKRQGIRLCSCREVWRRSLGDLGGSRST